MKRRIKFLILVFVGLLWLNGSSAYATDYSSTAIKKALLTGVQRCYSSGIINTSAGTLSGFSSFSNVILSDKDDSHFIALPSSLTGIVDDDVSCDQLFMGYPTGGGSSWGGSFEGVFTLAGLNGRPTSATGKKNLLEGMGYTEQRSSNTNNTRRIDFTYNQEVLGTTSQIKTDTIVATLDNSGRITELNIEYLGDYAQQNEYGSAFFGVVDGKIRLLRATTRVGQYGTWITTYYDTTKGVGDMWDGENGFLNDLRSTISKRGSFSYSFTPPHTSSSIVYTYSLPNDTTAGNYDPDAVADATYEIELDASAGPPSLIPAINSAIAYLSGNVYRTVNDLKYSEAEQIALLSAYIKSHFYEGLDPSDYWVCGVTDWADYGAYTADYEIHMTSGGVVEKNCRLNFSKLVTADVVHGFSGDRFDASGNTELTFEQTIAEINRLVGELPDDEVIVSPTPGDVTTDTSEYGECLNQASALGWILCPVLSFVQSAVESFYSNIEENWLPVEANMLRTQSSNVGETAVYEGWKIFRNFANIIFAILLVIVVLSQVSGFGLSNYGIKKMLPTLIIMAVLVNLSFFICQVVVDAVNVIGGSIDGVIGWISSQIQSSSSWSYSTSIKSAISGLFAVAGIGAGMWGIDFVAQSGNMGGFLLMLLVAGFGLIISIFFFFVLLAVRKAGIYLLVLISPLAIICYALPNTKNLFDRWKKLFIALLLVYPICQAITAGGRLVSHIMLNQGDESFMMNLIAVIIAFAPVFFIPSIVRNSMTLLGNLGAKLTQAGNRFRGLATGALNRSDTLQRARTSLDYFGANRGGKLAGRGNGALSRLVRNRIDRGAAKAKVSYKDMLQKDASSEYISKTMTTDSINKAIADQNYKYGLQLVDEAANAAIAGEMDYIDDDGSMQKVVATDFGNGGSLEKALNSYYRQYQASGGTDQRAGINMRAIAKILLDNGGNPAVSALGRFVQGSNFFKGFGKGTNTAGLKHLADYVQRNNKWSGLLKSSDRATMETLSDSANKEIDSELNTLSGYQAKALSSAKADAFPALSTQFYESAEELAKHLGSFSKEEQDLIRGAFGAFSTQAELAASNGQIYGKLNDGDWKHVKDLYESSFKLQNGNLNGFQQLVVGKDNSQRLDVPHGSASASSSGLSQPPAVYGWSKVNGEWINTKSIIGKDRSGAPIYQKLTADQISLAEQYMAEHPESRPKIIT